MPTLILVRHGEVANPNDVVYADLPGFDLSGSGVLQAHAVGRYLEGSHIDAVVSSPLARAVHTASAIARRHSLAVTIDNRLTETGMYPSWTGLRWEEVQGRHGDQLDGYLRDATALVDVSESINHVAARMRQVVADSIAADIDRFALVGHQDPIQALRLTLLTLPLASLRTDPPVHGSVTTLVTLDGRRWERVASWRPNLSSPEAE